MPLDTAEPRSRPGFSIYRGQEAPPFNEIDVMAYDGVTPELEKRFADLGAAGVDEGQTVKLLFAGAGMSLTYAWFRSGFPLPRHSHDADCLYYIIAGSLSLGTETLGKGDGFFVPSDAAYSYVPGPEGVEVLEFRTAETFNIRFLAANPNFWAKAMATVEAERPGWAAQTPPSEHPAR